MDARPVEARSGLTWASRDLNARQAILIACIAMATLTGLDLGDGRLGFLFSLSFVLIVVTVALGVDLDSLFQAGVFPPMLLIGTLAFVAMFWPDAIHVNGLAKDAGFIGRLIAATIDHGKTLVVGHGVALGLIVLRIMTAPDR
jgi:TRAP-type C4-dicarboxylate transport system permease large subunit